MATIPWPLSSSPGDRPQESAGRLVNAYAEPRGEDAGPVWRRAPGLVSFVETGQETFRGAIVMPGVIYAAYADVLMAITFQDLGESDSEDPAWVAETYGSLSGTDRLFFARNNAATPDVVVVGSLGALIITSEGVEEYPDGDVGSPNAVAFLAGYFFFTYGEGTCRTSGINTTDINPLDIATAEQHPDGLIRPQPFRGQMLLCGRRTIEAWQNTGNPEAFPFSYSYTVSAGLIAAHAMAGGTDEFLENLLWVADDNTVRRLNGYTPEKVSPPHLDKLIEAVADKTTLEACVYSSGGHKFWQLSCGSWTWVFDLNTEKWCQRDSYLQPRSRITQSFSVGADLVGVTKWLAGDTQSGSIVEITRTAHTELDQPLRWLMESGEVQKFPNRIQVARADFDFTVGVGIATGIDPIQTDPVVNISWSNDGGVKWSKPLIRKLGRQANGGTEVTVLNTGLSGPKGRRWRLEIYDPVDIAFFGADQSADIRSS